MDPIRERRELKSKIEETIKLADQILYYLYRCQIENLTDYGFSSFVDIVFEADGISVNNKYKITIVDFKKEQGQAAVIRLMRCGFTYVWKQDLNIEQPRIAITAYGFNTMEQSFLRD